MSLNCFFGLELKPDGVPVTPVIPPHSSLVITQCAVTSVVPPPPSSPSSSGASEAAGAGAPQSYGAVTLYVQSHELPHRFAVCTLSPAQQVTYCPLQLLFSKRVTFTLVTQRAPENSSGGGKTAAAVARPYPTVHLTGYYESEDSDDEDEDELGLEEEEDGSDGDGADSGEEEHGVPREIRGQGRRRQR